MTPIKEAVAVVGSYTDRTGAEKKRYQRVGTLFAYDDGNQVLKIDALPISKEWTGFVSFFDIKDKADAPKTAQGGGGSTGPDNFSFDDGDSIPFLTQWSAW